MLAGMQLDGPQLIETNPPLVVWYSLLPASLTKLTHLSYTFSGEFIAIGLALLSWFVCCKLIRMITSSEGGAPWALALVTGVVELFLIERRLGELSLTLSNVGLKEYFVVIFLLPYFLTRLVASDRLTRTARILIGIAAGLAICFKPHQILAVLFYEAVVFIYKRDTRNLFRSEVFALAITCVSYPLAVAVFCPMFLKAVLPMMLDTYWGLGDHTAFYMLAHQDSHHIAATLLMFAIWICTRKFMRTSIVPVALLAASIGSGFAFALQHTGWSGHQLPAWDFVLLATGWMIVDLGASWAAKRQLEIRLSPLVYIGVGLVVVLLLGFQAMRVTKRQEARLLKQPTITQELAMRAAGARVYLLSTSMPPFEVLLTHNLTWASRYAHLWMLPAIALNETPAHPAGRPFKPIPPVELAALADQVHREVTGDIAFWRPEVVFVEHFSPENPPSFDNLQWFLQDGNFSQEWTHYKLVKKVANFDGSLQNAYDEYVRVEN